MNVHIWNFEKKKIVFKELQIREVPKHDIFLNLFYICIYLKNAVAYRRLRRFGVGGGGLGTLAVSPIFSIFSPAIGGGCRQAKPAWPTAVAGTSLC